MVAQVSSGRSIGFDLHADSIALPGKRPRKRVAAKDGWAADDRLQTQDHVLPGHRCGERLTVRTLHGKREDVRGLLIDGRHTKCTKTRCGRMRSSLRHQSGVAAGLVLQQGLK